MNNNAFQQNAYRLLFTLQVAVSLSRGVSVWRVSVQGGLCVGGSLFKGFVSGGGGGLCQGVPLRQRPSPPVNRMSDASKNITLLHTSFAGGKYTFMFRAMLIFRKFSVHLILITKVSCFISLISYCFCFGFSKKKIETN